MTIEITADLSRVTPEQVEAVYESVGFGWSYKPLPLERLFGPGVFGFFALDRQDGRLVGLLRALSDDLSVTWIAEVCVLPSHQRQGIGARLMQALNERFPAHAIYAEPFTHNVDFITKQGLKARPILVACSRGPLKAATAAA